jgi:hypothetical protein
VLLWADYLDMFGWLGGDKEGEDCA